LNTHRDILKSSLSISNTTWCFNHESWRVLFEQFYIFKWGTSGTISSWSFDIISSSLVNDLSHYSHFILCEVASFNNNFESFILASLFDLGYFIHNFHISSFLKISNIDNHIYFISSILNCLLSLENLGLSWGIAKWESNNCSDLYIRAL
jgi:hypothetical protein